MNYTEQFQSIIERRRSNRKFDPNVIVPDEVIKRSLEKAILSPNSSNMQLWEFYIVKSDEKKKKFVSYCLDQSAARTAQQFVVFVTRQDLWQKRAKWNIERIKESADGNPENLLIKRGLDYYEKLMPITYFNDCLGIAGCVRWVICAVIGLFRPMMRFGGKADQRVMVHKSCALAAQTFMLAIAAEDFDTCPMEGFDKVRVKRELNLPWNAEVNMIIAVGKGTDKGIWGKRFRVPYNEVVFTV
ncbi:MAG: nitroreductase family protein [Bacteroidia bacterium]